MESICTLVDSIPEHELIALSCGNELLLKRAHRFVRVGHGIRYDIQFAVGVVTILFSLSYRKRILATGASSLLRVQLPDSTVLNEPSSKENSCYSSDTSGILSCRNSAPLDCKNPPQIRSTSSVFVDYDSDQSDSIIHVNPLSSTKSTAAHVDYQHCDSPTVDSVKNAHLNFSKNNSTDLDRSDLFSPKRPEITLENASRTPATEDVEQDDFYIDDFDIDDLNDSDIPNYYEESPLLSGLLQNPSTINRTIKEGGPTKSQWEKKPTTPASTPKPSNILSPGKQFSQCAFMSQNLFAN